MLGPVSNRLFGIVLLALATVATAQEVTLEKIMADPDWIGRGPQRAYWSDDGRSIYYYQERGEEEAARDLIQMDLTGKIIRTVPDADLGMVDDSSRELSPNKLRKAYSRNGDLFVKDLVSGHITQLTKTTGAESSPRFLLDNDHLAFNRGRTVVVRNLATDLEYEVCDVRGENDPDERKESEDFLVQQQKKLLEIIRSDEERREAARKRSRAQHAADATRVATPFYLGTNYEIVRTTLLPREDYMLVVVRDKRQQREGKRAIMPNYVTESGDVATRNVRTKVGTTKTPSDELRLLDLRDHKVHKLDLAVLPGIEVDPLAFLTKDKKPASEGDAENADKGEEKAVSAARPRSDARPKPRPVSVRSIDASQDGRKVLVQVASQDTKDRWIARIDFDSMKLVPLYREADPGWVRGFGVDWLPDNQRFIFVSEETGYSHLYVADAAGGTPRALTSGDYEVSSTHLSNDGRYVYYRANAEHPGIHEAYRVAIDSGKIEQLTKLGGNNSFVLSPSEGQMLITHSETTRPGELYLQSTETGSAPQRLTQTVSKDFTAIDWIAPQVIAVPSSAGGKPIYSRLYVPKDGSHKTGPKRPAVFFIHGAGYLQDAHHGWSTYTHEFMFHTLLVQKGYVVLDMDYRGSAGYGAKWRTAIYRQMGTPEVQDLADGVAWLAKEHNVDPTRVGCYGGSYGGFLTLMALFTKPDLFACGAALRPVTDWAHYNHGYTANILNVPSVDPEAYERSSPIYFAEGLKNPLLICHGMQDDNVFFEDSVRLAQRLIELKKENWELAIYPIEAHGFRQPSSWLDEYRRIFTLFEKHLK